MNPVEAVVSVFKNYFNFTGVARRSEFWWYSLFAFLVGLVTSLIDQALFPSAITDIRYSNGPVGTIVGLAMFLPGLAVSVRRLRDAGRHWAWLFIAFVPLIGAIVLIVFWCSPSRSTAPYWGAPQQPSNYPYGYSNGNPTPEHWK